MYSSSNSNNLIKNLPPAKFPIPHLNTIWKTLISGFTLFFLNNRWLWVILDGKSSQEYPVNAGVPQGSIIGPTLLLLYINDLPNDLICNIAISAEDTTFYSRCDQASDLWQ